MRRPDTHLLGTQWQHSDPGVRAKTTLPKHIFTTLRAGEGAVMHWTMHFLPRCDHNPKNAVMPGSSPT